MAEEELNSLQSIQDNLKELNDLNKNYKSKVHPTQLTLHDLKLEQAQILDSMHTKTKNALTDTDSVPKRLKRKINAFKFSFTKYTDTNIVKAFKAQKALFIDDLNTNKENFKELLVEEKKIIDEKFGDEYNYEKIIHPVYSNNIEDKQTLTVGNTISIRFCDTLSFSSGDYINATIKRKTKSKGSFPTVESAFKMYTTP